MELTALIISGASALATIILSVYMQKISTKQQNIVDGMDKYAATAERFNSIIDLDKLEKAVKHYEKVAENEGYEKGIREKDAELKELFRHQTEVLDKLETRNGELLSEYRKCLALEILLNEIFREEQVPKEQIKEFLESKKSHLSVTDKEWNYLETFYK